MVKNSAAVAIIGVARRNGLLEYREELPRRSVYKQFQNSLPPCGGRGTSAGINDTPFVEPNAIARGLHTVIDLAHSRQRGEAAKQFLSQIVSVNWLSGKPEF
jgi:hypothetical protein